MKKASIPKISDLNDMKTIVNVAKLKNDLSKYLRLVKNGHEIVITDHKKPVAKVIPLPSDCSLEFLEPTDDLSLLYRLSKRPIEKHTWSAVKMLIEERQKR